MTTVTILSILIAFVYSLFLEWALHKYILHGLGKKRKSPFRFHYEHHGKVRRNSFKENAGAKRELFSLGMLIALHTPIWLLSPAAFWTLLFCAIHYYVAHAYSHINPEWARKWLPHHYDHHMGANQHTNWGVRFDWIDRLLGTREPFVGTVFDEKTKIH